MTCFLINEFNGGKPNPKARVLRQFLRASDEHHVLSFEKLSQGVAYDEAALRRMVQDTGLVVSDVMFGLWANSAAAVPGHQDCIVAIKPS